MLIRTIFGSDEQNDRSITEIARRAQIVEAAIDVIARHGYARASLARIAREAELSSTGIITYHFDGKDELMREVMGHVLREFAAFVAPRAEEGPSPAARLRAFLEANVDFMRTHRPRLIAMLQIAANIDVSGGLPRDDIMEADLAALAELFREGQRSGEFRSFDPEVMAIAVRSVRDGLIGRLAVDEDLDLDACAREIVTMFHLATRNEAAAEADTDT